MQNPARDRAISQDHGEVTFVRDDPLGQLEGLAATIGREVDATRAAHAASFEVWQIADKLVRLCAERSAKRAKARTRRLIGCQVPPEAVDLFNQLANDGVSLKLPPLNHPLLTGGGVTSTDRDGNVMDIPVRELAGRVALMIYSHLFLNSEAHRLKVCQYPACAKLFVDRARGNQAVRCSPACTWRAWNRAARRAAGHGKLAKRGKQHGSS